MTSQLCHNFQASQAVHWADYIRTPNFEILVNSMSTCGPQVDTLIYLLLMARVPPIDLLTAVLQPLPHLNER